MLLAEGKQGLIDARLARRQGSYRCPACQGEVRLHRGHQVPPYFAHLPRSQCVIGGEAESQEHLRGKRQLARFFADWGPTSLEHVLPTIAQRADVWVARSQRPLAIEFQCSPLAVDQVRERTQGYQRLGVYPLWVLGHRYAHRKLNWSLIERFACWLPRWGLCLLFWDVQSGRLVIQHHLHQDVVGRYRGCVCPVRRPQQVWQGDQRGQTVPAIDLLRIRADWTRALLHGSRRLRPIQAQLYILGHHLAGYPQVLATRQGTPPVFGQGILLWRIMMGAWLFQRSEHWELSQIRELAQRAFELVGGHERGVRFSAANALSQAVQQLLVDLIRQGYMNREGVGWRVVRVPIWAADYTAWLKNYEKN